MKQIRLGLVFFVLILGSMAGVSQDSRPRDNSASLASAKADSVMQVRPGEVSEEFVIGRQDVLSINVWKEPDLSTKVVVRPDGKITLPLINEIQAIGLTTKQLQERIGERLKDFVAVPNVSVVIAEIHSQIVYLFGQVSRPGAYPLGSPTTVLQLLAQAGSFTEIAKTRKIKIVRQEGDRTLQFPFSYDDFVDGKNMQQNIKLKNGDIVIIP
ncbi:MAG: polysaccharide biosynthesis/export family protein [Nitrososphaera sp.]